MALAIAGVIGGFEDVFDPTEEEIQKAEEIWTQILKNTKFIWESGTELEQAWANGEVGISYVYGSAAKRMKKEGLPIEVIPPVLPWICGLSLAVDGPGSEEQAYAYINAMLDRVGGKALYEEYGYGHANRKTFDLIDPEELKAAGLDDPVGMLSTGLFFDPIPPEKKVRLIAIWEEVQAAL